MNLQKISENRHTIRKLLNENQRQKVLISHLEAENNWLREQLATIANTNDCVERDGVLRNCKIGTIKYLESEVK